jgi:hypothetical protein
MPFVLLNEDTDPTLREENKRSSFGRGFVFKEDTLPEASTGSVANDMLTEAKMGVGSVVSGGMHAGGLLADYAGASSARDTLFNWRDQAAQKTAQYAEELSPAQRAADEQQILQSTGPGVFDVEAGPGASNWRTYAGQISRSLPGTAAGMGIGYGITRAALPAVRAALPAISTGAAEAISGAVGFGAGEGMVSAGPDAENVYRKITAMDPAKLASSPYFQQRMQEHGDVVRARDEVAIAASKQTMWDTGIATALLGAPMGAVFGKMFGSTGVTSSRGMNTLIGFLGESAQEGVQSGAESYLQNTAVRDYADPTQAPGEGVLNDVVSGAASGGIMGAGVGAITTPAQTPSAIPRKINLLDAKITLPESPAAAERRRVDLLNAMPQVPESYPGATSEEDLFRGIHTQRVNQDFDAMESQRHEQMLDDPGFAQREQVRQAAQQEAQARIQQQEIAAAQQRSALLNQSVQAEADPALLEPEPQGPVFEPTNEWPPGPPEGVPPNAMQLAMQEAAQKARQQRVARELEAMAQQREQAQQVPAEQLLSDPGFEQREQVRQTAQQEAKARLQQQERAAAAKRAAITNQNIQAKADPSLLAPEPQGPVFEPAAVPLPKAAATEAPSSMQLAMQTAKQRAAASPPPAPDVKPKSGVPFKTQKSAALWLKQHPEYEGYAPVQLAPDKWVGRKTPPQKSRTQLPPERALAAADDIGNLEDALKKENLPAMLRPQAGFEGPGVADEGQAQGPEAKFVENWESKSKGSYPGAVASDADYVSKFVDEGSTLHRASSLPKGHRELPNGMFLSVDKHSGDRVDIYVYEKISKSGEFRKIGALKGAAGGGINNIAVSSDMRRKGIGTLLVSEAEKEGVDLSKTKDLSKDGANLLSAYVKNKSKSAPPVQQPIQEAEAPAIGMTRLYHGSATPGRYDGKAWFSTSRKYAENYRDGAELQYIDYPTAKLNEVADPDGYGQTVDKGFTVNLELDSSETGLRKPVKKKSAPTTAKPIKAIPVSETPAAPASEQVLAPEKQAAPQVSAQPEPKAAAPAPATHQEGGKVEEATPAVVAESLEKSAAKTPATMREARTALVARIDEALKVAKGVPEDAPMIPMRSVSKGGRARNTKHIDGQYAKEKLGHITFDVPGDGTFKVINSKEHLTAFRKRVLASPGFKNSAAVNPAPQPVNYTADPRLEGKKVVIKDAVVDGKQAEAGAHDARSALQEVDDQLDAARRLLKCLS